MVSDDERESRVIGGPTLHDDVINLADYDAAWPELFAAEEARIGAALAGLAIRVEHAGSTSVPGLAANVNVHVFSSGCPEADVMLAFRDHLRTNAADRSLHESAKRELASRRWTYVQNYADAKSDVVADIIKRAMPTPEAAWRPR